MQTALKPLDGCKKYIRPEISSGIVRQKKIYSFVSTPCAQNNADSIDWARAAA